MDRLFKVQMTKWLLIVGRPLFYTALLLLTLVTAIPAKSASASQYGANIGSGAGHAASAGSVNASQPGGNPAFRTETFTDDFEAFADGLMEATLSTQQIAGASVAVVRDGRVLLARGYGWADVENRIPADATTLFRIGSTTKLFTFISVMQLRDRGLLDLDTDVNRYLDFTIPATFDEPVTMRHLMTHTAGFEDRMFGLLGPLPDQTRGEWLRANLPRRVHQPGKYISYSNTGTTIAGYIVERLSGMKWEDYVEEHILRPLGMTNATGHQPVPDELSSLLSHGYTVKKGEFESRPFEFIEAEAPAGGMSASADAMARFMLALLNDGEFEGYRILEASTVREMHQTAKRIHPRINGMGLGFYEQNSHGLDIVGHGGSTVLFFTDMALIPEKNTGIFISFNSEGGAIPSFGLTRQLIIERLEGDYAASDREVAAVSLSERESAAAPLSDRELSGIRLSDRKADPDSDIAAVPLPDWDRRASAYKGSYITMRRSHSRFEKLLGLAIFSIRVTPGENGKILLQGPLGDQKLYEVEPGYFRQKNGHLEAGFVAGSKAGDTPSRYTHLVLNNIPIMTLERPGVLLSAGLHLTLFLISMLIFISMPVIMITRWILQKNYLEVRALKGCERRSRWLAIGYLTFVLLFLIMLLSSLGDMESFLAGQGALGLRLALSMPLPLAIWAILLVGASFRAVKERWYSLRGRVHYLLFSTAAVLFLWQLVYWNLFGWWNI